MFCDVRGFAAISEALKSTPEVLTEVINTLLTDLSDDILACGGTIDKYMGDCIMAFGMHQLKTQSTLSLLLKQLRE